MIAPTVSYLTDGVGADFRLCCARLFEERFGWRLSQSQSVTLERLVIEAAPDCGCASGRELYQAFLERRFPDILEALATRLTVGETHFFRVPAQVAALDNVILPDIIGKRGPERRLKIWVAGCSTGEEPYTVAILLRQQLPALQEWDVRLLATDLSRPALEAAQRAEYGPWSFRDTPAEMQERYFDRRASRWRLKDTVRRMVEFAPVNLADEPLSALSLIPGELDLILCRNVTIYFSSDATQRLYRQFASTLTPGGWLILGPSDPGPEPGGLLRPSFLPGAVVWQKAVSESTRSFTAISTARPNRDAAAAGGIRHHERRPVRDLVAQTQVKRVDVGVPRRTARPGRGDTQSAPEQAKVPTADGLPEAERHLVQGLTYLDERDGGRAVEALRRATYLQPDSALAYFALGRAYREIGHVGRARPAFLQARRLLSTSPADEPLPHSDGMTCGDLLHTVEIQLSMLLDQTGA